MRELRFDGIGDKARGWLMIGAYHTIFEGIPYISCILAGIALLSLLLQRNAVVARSIAFAFQFWIAPLFYLTYIGLAGRFSTAVTLATCLELLFLSIYFILFKRLFIAVTATSSYQLAKLSKYLRYGIWLLLILDLPVFVQSGVGIFSSGSRNQFLEGSRLNLYLVYTSALVQSAMTPVAAAIINAERRWHRLVVFYIVLVSLFSILSASKGGAILTLLAIVSLLKFECARDWLRVLLVPAFCFAMLFTSTVIVVGKFLSLDPLEMMSLMFTRLFLANDCRALAIDWSSYMGHDAASVFRESFRLYATLLGSPPQYPPLGQLLYVFQFGTEGLVGANTSSTALLIAYGHDIEKICFALLLSGVAISIGFLADIPSRYKVPGIAIGISWLSLLSQDFLAFQVWTNLLLVLLTVTVITMIIIKMIRVASSSQVPVQKPGAILPR